MKTDSNLVDVLCRRACAHPDRMAYRFLDDGEEEGGSLTYAEVDRRARALAAFLQREGGAGERALLLYPPGLDFVVSFLGCLYAGTVAVPAYPPRSNRPDSRLQAIARDARPRFALTTPALRDRAGVFLEKNPELAGVRWVATEEMDLSLADSWERGPELTSEGVAFLQYTSGSTATPKGVVVRHGNLVHNEEMIRRAFGQSEESVIVGWLPLYHDMGLIGNVLQPLYVGGTCVLMAPVAFLQRPSRWLRAISRYRATGSGGPNFAYELCVRKVGPEEREGLDLSRWEIAYNGAEPVRAETMERFAECFAPQGFRRGAFYPCYGLAEATLFVTGAERGSFPEVRQVDAEALERNRAEDARPGAASRSLVSCGSAWLDQRLEIVDPETCLPLPEGQVGEVWISGPSVAGGYWNRPEESARTFGARLSDGAEETFLRTGDLGFLSGATLYLTGRAKDLIILRGRNLYPQDLELTAERSHGDLRPGCGAAFAVEVDGEERLVLVQEVERDAEKRWQKGMGSAAEVAEAVRRAVATEHEAAIHAVVLLRAGSVPKTSSGKIRRQSCRADFLAGNLEAVEQWTEGGAAAGEAPRTPTEEKLERIWAEVLGLERVGVDRDLFELGADSLRATQLLARANEAFGVGLTIDSLFGAPSIAELATLLDQGDLAAADVPLVALQGGEVPLSFAQRRLWFLHQLDPENPVHNIAASIRLQGRLDVAALSAVFGEVVRRHEALRTGFASPGEEPVQVVRPAASIPMPVFDFSGLPLSRGGSAWEERERGPGGEGIAADLARLPFSLETGPFLRVALVRFSAEKHELLMSLHHIASDGGSLAVLVREMGALYEAFAAGRPSPLPPLPVQYSDYAAWQRRRLDAGALEAGLAFWRRQLGGELPVVELPADHPRPAVLSYRGAHCERLVPARLVERLEALAREGRATRFMALLAGFEALLHRYTGLDDLVVGTPIDGRNRVELEGLIGVFLNNLVLRTRLDGRPGFRELLARVRRTALDAYAHQEIPFERLVDELRPERDLSRTPLFQVMFVGQNAPLRRLELPGLELRPREVDLGTARFDLSLSMGEADGGWLGIWKYSTDLFEAATMERMAGHLESLLAAAVAEPDRPVALLPMLSGAERRQVVEVWNDTAAPFPDQATLHGLFQGQVRRTPDAIALEYGDRQLTYEDLNRRANRLAGHLRGLGVEADTLVGIAAERSIEMVVGLMGILKAGGAYVPVDPSYPQDRIAYMLEDSGVGVLLTQSHLELPATRAALVRLDEPLDGPDEGFDSGALPQSLAYCIYTSGSTGRPKGAGIPHRGIVNRLNWMQSAYRLTAEDRVLQKTPFSFDVSVWEFFWPLLTGARLVMSPPGAHQDAARLAELIRCHGITTLHFVPSMLQIFLDQDGLSESCRSVRRVFASGEALPFELKERFFARVPSDGDTELHNLYGPTEASVDVTYHACKPGGRAVPIGRPIDNTSILILDRESQPVPVGVPGELHIGGVNLARGYLGRPELTAERFVPNPFGDGGRLYRTGDLARLRTDGEVEYLGRLDFQVKIRGVRIELGEIEAELSRHPGVREVCVLARDGRLVAYLVSGGEDAPQTDELRSYLRGRLPEAMVPSAFVVLPAFPLNPSGKVDRKALPAPEADRPELEHGYEEPRTELERRLAGMWRDLLGIERVGIHDSFFELGGDSIQGAMFINRLQKELGRIVYVMALFDAPTVATFAEYLATAYPDVVGRLGGEAVERQAGDARMELEPALEKLRAAVSRRLGRAPGAEPTEIETRPVPRVVFLLSPFRSGSTLLRVMLAGHPGVFAPPELELLAFRTMDERRDVYSGRNRFAVEGLLRAVMDLHDCDADRARDIVSEAEDQGLTVGQFFRRLQEWAGGRLVVDKTPSYALDLWTMRRAERMFENPLYVHLIRHPRATIDSYLEAKMDQVYGFPFPPEEQAELVWTLAHRNILTFLEEVPAERRHRLLFEDLVKDPRGSMESLSRFLDLEMEESMLQPYQGQRMTDGLHAGTRMMGDPKFHEHQGIDASVADRWQTAGGSLAPESWQLAAELGYPAPKPAEDLSLRPVPREAGMPLSFSQERLWFLTQLDPDSPAYNMPAAVLLEGALDVPALARSFGEVRRRHEVLRTVYPAVNGEPAQQVMPATDDLPVMDLSGLPAESREGERRRLALEEGRRPFDLTVGPMLRTSLLKLGEQEHVLLLTMHHIASDGWTIGILIRELEALYTGSPLPDLPLQYADYAAWQRRWLNSAAMEQHLAYWRGRLSGRLPVLEMPTDRPRPALLTSRGARLSRTVPSAALEEIRAWSQKEGGTLFLTLLAAFNALLHRYTGQEDLLLGIPIANRNRLETEGLIGFFLNMVVQRTDLAGDPAFRELLSRVSEGFLGSTPHQEVPFEKLVEDLQPERDLSRTPIFQVQFSLQNTPTQALDLPGVSLKLLENHNRTTKFDFTVFLFDLPEGLTTTLEYNVDLYDESTIDRLLRHWETLLAGSVAAPELRLADLPMLAAEERAQLLTGWNTPAAELSSGPSLHRLFEAQAAGHPKSVAAVYVVSELSYRKLNERANQLAWRLRAMGVGPETPVGLCVERSLDTIVAILGILKAGGAYVPLDPAYPAERLSWILENALSTSSAPVLVTQSHLVERFDAPYPMVLLDKDRASLASESTENLSDLPGMGPDNVAYVIYTSGSTGRPKGVPVTHANAVRLFTATDSWFGFGPDDVWTVFHSYAFDFSVWEIWGALLYGGRLIVVPREVSMNPAAFHELLATEGVTVLSQTPSAFRQLIKAEEEGRGKLALKWVVFGGEALDLAALAPWIERHGDAQPRLINMYGITETTVHVTFRPVTKADLDRPGASPVGEPIPDLQVYLLGTHQELLPVGVPGEIHVGGAGLARGYLTRPELTAERFIPDPFSPRPGARLYRSGDLARRRPDGDLDYLGRIDGQVKIRGFRIELGEIESALNRHPGLRESVVMAQMGATGDRRLVAWIVPKDAPVSNSELREHLLQTLPEYMVPAAFVSLDKLPLTTHGKVDRRALPEPGSVLLPASELVAPRSRTEARLAEIWREVLRVEQVGVHDNFFELGGHSLLVSQLSSRVRNAFGVELPLRQVFEAPTLEALAARVEGVLPERQEGIPVVSRMEPLPLSFAQERLWFLDQLEPGSPLYNVPVALRLKGRLRTGVLAATFREIVRRHEALRTSFAEADGKPVQVIEPDATLDIPVVDISHLPSEEREAALARLAEQEARQPFDLRRAPLLRVQAVKLAEDEHAVLATLHHIVSDGWSLGVLVHEVAALYSGKTLPELAVQYADFAVWQRGRLTGELAGDWLETEVSHWRSALAGASTVLDLPTDHPRPARQSFRGRHLPVELPANLVDRIKELSRDGSTLFMALLAGFQTLLYRYTGQDDFLVGSPVANRTREEVEPLIGFFVNTLALRARVDGDPTFGELVGRVKSVTLDAYAHQDLPFERLVEALEPQRDLSRSPLFQALFVLQNAPFEPLALPDLMLAPLELESGTSKFDLSLYFTERPDGRMGGFLEIDAALFEEATAHRLLEHFRILLESAVADPGGRVSELALMSRSERRQVLKGWNETASELPESTVVSLFEEQARRTPAAVAVSQGEARLTYSELDERAEGLAAQLRSQGIGPESRVGISMERTPDMLVAVLGVLKSGAAYVPLDPSHPQERLNLILEAARPQTVLTELSGWAPSPAKRGRVGEEAPDGLAYILFTSGSTGRPKGVQIPQRALVNFLLSMAREPGLEPSDVLLAVTTLSFDIAGLELLLPLIVGARVEIATREETSDAELLKKRLAGVTVMQATPATWRMLLDAGWEGGDIKALCGGEALPSDLAAKLLPRVGSLWNMYGPTETTIWSSTRRVAHEEEGVSIAVGSAIANTQLYVLDRRLEPVPVGIPGELCIGGEGLARGYLDAPDLTAERFVPDPFAGGRMYRTGDLVRWRPDGRIEFLGRIDFQVKVRGFRIELGEIEAALVSHPAVRQAAAGLRGDRLVAWIVADGKADLREHLKGRLPEYMVPSAFVTLDAFPLTPSGKVDRKALPEPELAGGERRHLATVAPRGPVEEMIAGIWCELLDVPRVGSGDSFFELGGHSLLATQLASRLRRAFDVELPVRQLFETPTLARLAELVQAARLGAVRTPPLHSMPRPVEIPLSYAQERLWFVEQLERDHAMYNLPAAIRLRGELRVDVLEGCLREIVHRHEALRTRFVTVHGHPTQVIDEGWRPSLPVVDLRGLPLAAVEAELHRRTTADEHRPYDLTTGPLVRATLLRLADADSVVLFGMHHIISDRWSMGLLLRELAALYPALAVGDPSPLPALPVQYADYSLWQREWLRGEVLDAQLAYWTGKLAKLQPLDLPTDRDAASGQIFRAGDLTFELEAPLAEALYALARGQAASPFMVLLAVLQALLQRHSGEEDIAVGAPIAGRTRSEVEDLIGFFVNTLILRTRVEPGLSFRELLERVRTTTLEAYDHQDLPFSRVVDALRPSRRQGLGLVDVMFTMQNQPMPDMSLPGLEMSVLPISEEADLRINFALSLRMWESGGRMKGGLSYNTALFDQATAEQWRDNFLTLLAAAVERPEQAISEVPLLSVGERRQVTIPEPEHARPAAVSESVAKQRADLTSRRDHLSAAKRELLEKRLRGAKAGAGTPAPRPAQPAQKPAIPKALVKLQDGDGSRPPFFCVHAIGGSVFSYGELARALGSAQTFYGVQSPGLDGGPLLDEVPAIAAAYLAEIEAAAPNGPVLLGGWSFGGVVAFEMARQLRSREREVPLVVLLDSYAPSGADLLAERSDADLLRPFLRDQAGVQGRGAEWLDEMPMAGEEAVLRMLEQAREAGVLRADLKSEKVERLLGVYKANLRALSSYQPQPYGGRILLFRSEGAESRHSANGWEGLAGEPIETQSVSGDHYTMLAPPHVVELANLLAGCIERALRASVDASTEARVMA
ncbi:MAG TPA: amino acid adenylation domain-containing protein [Thermoanaerobaculia bacterium]|nr:amino acid adenylation domain-containing protein [Thermoanaerobaculia bacterium]